MDTSDEADDVADEELELELELEPDESSIAGDGRGIPSPAMSPPYTSSESGREARPGSGSRASSAFDARGDQSISDPGGADEVSLE